MLLFQCQEVHQQKIGSHLKKYVHSFLVAFLKRDEGNIWRRMLGLRFISQSLLILLSVIHGLSTEIFALLSIAMCKQCNIVLSSVAVCTYVVYPDIYRGNLE